MMSYGDQRPKSFQGERFAEITSHANISEVKLSILSSETFLCTTVPVNQEEEGAKSFTLFVPGSEGRVQIPMQTYWQPGQFLEGKGETGVSLR